MTTSNTPHFATQQYALELGAEVSGEAIKMVEITDTERKKADDALSKRIDRLVETNSLIENKAS